jgi:uncharacterized repeat protein (TIGR03803 family)
MKSLRRACSSDGGSANLIFEAAGNLYSTTSKGGAYGVGYVFELNPPDAKLATPGAEWFKRTLFSFDGTDGKWPVAGVVFDAVGNSYGTTSSGGAYGDGTVFELTPTVGGGWTETVLQSFNTGKDGFIPCAGLILDSAGNLYGTTVYGGHMSCDYGNGCGVVFEITP